MCLQRWSEEREHLGMQEREGVPRTCSSGVSGG